jgi:hypothetical protein
VVCQVFVSGNDNYSTKRCFIKKEKSLFIFIRSELNFPIASTMEEYIIIWVGYYRLFEEIGCHFPPIAQASVVHSTAQLIVMP